jgi:Fe-S cluster biogenesis protein NfuA
MNTNEIEIAIRETLERVRPYLQEDEGDVEFVRFEEQTSVAEVRFKGSCRDCPMAMMTLRAGVERYILKYVTQVVRVELVV